MTDNNLITPELLKLVAELRESNVRLNKRHNDNQKLFKVLREECDSLEAKNKKLMDEVSMLEAAARSENREKLLVVHDHYMLKVQLAMAREALEQIKGDWHVDYSDREVSAARKRLAKEALSKLHTTSSEGGEA